MRTLTLIALLLATSFFASAEDVKLKITYKGNGLDGHKVSVYLGDAVLGSGTTDSGGEVTISVSSLPTKTIDLKGEKTCEGARKSWSASGYVTLDGSNYAHVKMEDLVNEMVEASGGMMSESMLVASYGLVCAGSSSSGSSDSASGADTSSGSSLSSMEEEEEDPLMTKAEMQAQQKQNLENKIDNLQFKIEKKQSKIDSGKLTGDKKADGEQDIREWEIEQKIAQNKLDKLNLQIEKGMLNKLERKQFKDREAELKAELKEVKSGGVSKSSSSTETVSEETLESVEEAGETAAQEANKYDIQPEDLANMSNNDLKKRKLGLKSDLSKKKVKLKTRKNALSPNEVKALEEEIAAIEKAIEIVETEQANRE